MLVLEPAVPSVLSGSTAEASDAHPGDVIASIDGMKNPSVKDIQSIIVSHIGGATLTLDLVRKGQVIHLQVPVKPMPMDQIPGVTSEYRSVVTRNGTRLRTVVSIPTAGTGPYPAVMYLQGGSCSGIDMPFLHTPPRPHMLDAEPIYAAAANGFVTMRVDKSGSGDSKGPLCAEIGYWEELDGYEAALAALRSNAAVDPKRILLLGISLVGVFAPILANET